MRFSEFTARHTLDYIVGLDAGANARITPEDLKAQLGASAKPMYYVVDGDSLTADDSTTGLYNWFNLFCAQLDNAGVLKKNFASSGKKLKEVWQTYNAAGDSPSHLVSGGHQFSPSVTGGRGVYFIFCGTNDLGAADNDSAATLYGYIADLVTWAKADGYDQVIVFTLTPRTGISSDAQDIRTAFNALIVANEAGADIVFDIAASFADPTSSLYDGGLHFTPELHERIAIATRGALNGLLWGPRIVASVDAMAEVAAEFPGQVIATLDGNTIAFGKTGAKGNANANIAVANAGVYFLFDIAVAGRLFNVAGNVIVQGANPLNANSDTLGVSAARWGAVYGVAANFSGNVDLGGLPTSDPHVAGRLWRSTNDVKVSTG